MLHFSCDMCGKNLIPGAAPRFEVRVEAFAYPNTHSGGKPLNQEAVAAMSVAQIAHLHDTCGGLSPSEIYSKDQEPVGIADMLFSQPVFIRR